MTIYAAKIILLNYVFIFLFNCEMSLNSAGQQGSIISTETISQNIDITSSSFLTKDGDGASSRISKFIPNSAFIVRSVDCLV